MENQATEIKKAIDPNARELKIEGLRLIFPNFAGRPDNYHAEGLRTFHVPIPWELASAFDTMGYPYRTLAAKTDEDAPTPVVKVNVNIEGVYPPKVITIVDETNWMVHNPETIAQLDRMRFKRTDKSRVRFGEFDMTTQAENGFFPFLAIDCVATLYYNRKFKHYSWYLKNFYGHIELDDIQARYAAMGIE